MSDKETHYYSNPKGQDFVSSVRGVPDTRISVLGFVSIIAQNVTILLISSGFRVLIILESEEIFP